MARKNVKVVIPTNPDDMIDLGKNISAKHTADGTSSPLNGLDMTAFGTRVTNAETKNEEQKQLRRDAEMATEDRDGLLGRRKDQNVNTEGTVLNIISRVRDILLGTFKGEEQHLGQWGFEVNQSTSHTNGGGGGTTAGTGSLSGNVKESVSENPIGGALVEVVGTGVKATTDANGNFTLTGIPTGDQVIRISAPGYQTVEGPITIVEGVNPPQNIQLSPVP